MAHLRHRAGKKFRRSQKVAIGSACPKEVDRFMDLRFVTRDDEVALASNLRPRVLHQCYGLCSDLLLAHLDPPRFPGNQFALDMVNRR